MINTGFDIFVILLLILGNGVFALSEMAVVSSRKPKLKHLAQSGNRKAARVLELKDAPNRFLSTVQFGITTIGILAGAFGGAKIAIKLEPGLAKLPFLASYSVEIALGLVVAAITFVSLVLGEIVPKRLALYSPEKTSMAIVGPISALGALVAPFVKIVGWMTDMLLKPLGIKRSEDTTITREEVQVMVEQGSHAGVFHKAEIGMVKGVMRLDENRVGDLMTPRPKIVWLDTEDEKNEMWRKIVKSNHSNFPLCEDDLDRVIGMVSVKAIWANDSLGLDTNIRNLSEDPLTVPESMLVIKLLEAFKQSGKRIALVSDEFGSIAGLVTLIDVMEAIVGNLPEQTEKTLKPYRQREDGSWEIDAMLEIDEFKDLLQLQQLPHEEIDDYHSAGGFALSLFGNIPAEGDHFQHENWRFEILTMDRHRIARILAQPLSQDPETGKPEDGNENPENS